MTLLPAVPRGLRWPRVMSEEGGVQPPCSTGAEPEGLVGVTLLTLFGHVAKVNQIQASTQNGRSPRPPGNQRCTETNVMKRTGPSVVATNKVIRRIRLGKGGATITGSRWDISDPSRAAERSPHHSGYWGALSVLHSPRTHRALSTSFPARWALPRPHGPLRAPPSRHLCPRDVSDSDS